MRPPRSPAVSVIVPTHQRRVLVQRAVASVMAQTFRDFELIVVDDGSVDGTREALMRLPSVRYRWQPQRGVSAARNAGLATARGEVIAFLDSDDLWLPEHLAVIVALLQDHPTAILASTSAGYRRGGRQPLGQARLVNAFPRILYRGLAGFVSSNAVRRGPLVEAGGFDEAIAGAEDADLWLRLALRGPFVLLNRRTAVIGKSRESLSGQARRSGATLAGLEHSLHRVVAELSAADDRVATDHVERALAYVAALRSIYEAPPDAPPRLSFALAPLPDDGIGYALFLLGRLPRGREHHIMLARLQSLIDAWPDRRSPILIALRARALLEALGAGRPGTAGALLLALVHRDSRTAGVRLVRQAASARILAPLRRRRPRPGSDPAPL